MEKIKTNYENIDHRSVETEKVEKADEKAPGNAAGMPTAFILAGGRGARLRPLTDETPKPLLPVGGKPLLFHILEDLAANGVSRAVVLTGYRGEMIEEALSKTALPLEVTTVCEEMSLGSAGAVRAALRYAGERCFVICGDIYGRRDYRGFLKNHLQNRADASILLTKVDDPLEYGLARCDKEGRVLEFLEKPSWSRVFTDRANAGVYLLERSVLESIKEGGACDFSKDVFPELLLHDRRIFGYEDGLFWCDVGTPAAYLAVNLRESGGENIFGNRVSINGARIEKSLLFDGAHVGRGSVVRSSILCEDSFVGENCTVPEGCVISSGCALPDGSILAPGSVVTNTKGAGGWTVGHTVPGDLNGRFFDTVLKVSLEEADERFFDALGQAYASALPKRPDRIAVFRADAPGLEMPFEALIRGVGRVCRPWICDRGFRAFAAWAPVGVELPLSLYMEGYPGGVAIHVYDSCGMPPSRAYIRSVRDKFDPENLAPGRRLPERSPDALSLYASRLQSLCPEGLSGISVGMGIGGSADRTLAGVLLSLGASLGKEGKCRISLRLSLDGERVELWDDSGKIDFWHASALLLRDKLDRGETVESLPFRVPDILFEMIGERGRKVVGFPLTPADDRDLEARFACRNNRWLFDGSFAALGVLGTFKKSGKDCAELLSTLPPFSVLERRFDCRADEKIDLLLSNGALPAGEGMKKQGRTGKQTLRAGGGGGLELLTEAASDYDALQLMRSLQKELQSAREKKKEKMRFDE